MAISRDLVFHLHLIVSWTLVGLIWTIQIVHYPAFAFIDPEVFTEFQAFHMRSITCVVMPLMLAELALSFLDARSRSFKGIPLVAFGIVVCIWLSTFFWQMPIHQHLLRGKDLEKIGDLVGSNTLRTALWSMKAILLSVFAIQIHTQTPSVESTALQSN